jgi:hypothetical protein
VTASFRIEPRKPFSGKEAAEKLLAECVILSKAKDLLFARAEEKADPSIAQNRRDLRMTLLRFISSACEVFSSLRGRD